MVAGTVAAVIMDLLPPTSLRGQLTASHEVHNFEAISVGELLSRPLVAGHDLPVQFHGNPIRFHAQLLNQPAEGLRTLHTATFSIDDEIHCWSSSQARVNGCKCASKKRTAWTVEARSPFSSF
jgi:hypothetical protein